MISNLPKMNPTRYEPNETPMNKPMATKTSFKNGRAYARTGAIPTIKVITNQYKR